MRYFLLALLLCGCVPIYPTPTPAPQPTPQPQPQPQPDPAALEVFQRVKPGMTEAQALEILPKPTPAPVMVGSLSIRSWTTTVPRPSGGFVAWEVHVREGVVSSSFPW